MEYLGILLLVLGFVLIGIEMVLPGFGAPGISGIVSLTASVIIMADSVEQGLMMTVLPPTTSSATSIMKTTQ